jgi:hypothetical protein
MHFEHELPLVSVSEDGLELPSIYTFRKFCLYTIVRFILTIGKDDAKLKLDGFTQISPVVEINEVDAPYFLEANYAIRLGYQDPDARLVFPRGLKSGTY